MAAAGAVPVAVPVPVPVPVPVEAAGPGEEAAGPVCPGPARGARLPLARVKALVKADPDVSLASHEAVFVLARATVRGGGTGAGALGGEAAGGGRGRAPALRLPWGSSAGPRRGPGAFCVRRALPGGTGWVCGARRSGGERGGAGGSSLGLFVGCLRQRPCGLWASASHSEITACEGGCAQPASSAESFPPAGWAPGAAGCSCAPRALRGNHLCPRLLPCIAAQRGRSSFPGRVVGKGERADGDPRSFLRTCGTSPRLASGCSLFALSPPCETGLCLCCRSCLLRPSPKMLTCTLSKEKGKLCREKTWITPLKLLMNLLFWKVLWIELDSDGTVERWTQGGKQDVESSNRVLRTENLKWQPCILYEV